MKNIVSVSNTWIDFFRIACSSASLSEIVVPIIRITSDDKQEQVLGVLDVDSEFEGHFDEIDQYYLEQLVRESIEPCFWFKENKNQQNSSVFSNQLTFH